MEKNTFKNIPNEVDQSSETSVSQFWEALAGKKTVIDMGCGHGDFLIEYTEKYREKFFVGVEISRKRVFKTSHRLFKRNRDNYAVLHGDGEGVLKRLFPSASVDELHVNFPDPWLRLSQWKNRILKPSFLIEVVRVLKVGGIINFVTDVSEYATYVGEIIARFPLLESNYQNLIEKNLYESYPTLFYRRMSPLRDIHYISFTRTKDSA